MTVGSAVASLLPSGAFKGIALITPGGDLVYCFDPSKQQRWHAHLCAALQQHLQLPEAPHFLTPSHTATVDRWQDPQTRTLHTHAELYPAVRRHRALLAALFEVPLTAWHVLPWQAATDDPLLIEGHRRQFPQLWENHNLLLPVAPEPTANLPQASAVLPDGYVLQLFVSGHSRATERTLKVLHELLEANLLHPYTLKVIDVLKHPEHAELNHISATPTLLRVWPQPRHRIVGDLNLGDPQRLLQAICAPA